MQTNLFAVADLSCLIPKDVGFQKIAESITEVTQVSLLIPVELDGILRLLQPEDQFY
jgi:hypothetical protein